MVISEEMVSVSVVTFQVLNTVPGVGVAVGGALVQPQAKEGSIQVCTHTYTTSIFLVIITIYHKVTKD